MDILLGRQAVIDRRSEIFAYELFYREENSLEFPLVCSCKATQLLIKRNGLDVEVDHVTNGKIAMINFCEKNLINGYAKLLKPKEVVIEILETVPPSDEVYDMCVELAEQGFQLALDDFLYCEQWDRFLKIVHIVKFDLLVTPLESLTPLIKNIKQICSDAGNNHIKFLAEKVETTENYNKAKNMGFDYFQGYFFGRTERIEYSYLEEKTA